MNTVTCAFAAAPSSSLPDVFWRNPRSEEDGHSHHAAFQTRFFLLLRFVGKEQTPLLTTLKIWFLVPAEQNGFRAPPPYTPFWFW